MRDQESRSSGSAPAASTGAASGASSTAANGLLHRKVALRRKRQGEGGGPAATGALPAGAAADDPAHANAKSPAGGKVAKLAINADTETADRTKLTVKELQDAKVGHAWITLTYDDPHAVPDSIHGRTNGLLKSGGTAMGFWPLVRRASQWNADGSAKDPHIKDRLAHGYTPGAGADSDPSHHGFSMNPFKSVPGRVEEPDDAHRAKGTKSYDLTQAQVDQLLHYVDGKRSAHYNLYFFNCTTFATEAVSAAGEAPPSGELFGAIALPNELYKDILQMKVDGDKSATTTPLGPGETETVPKPHK